MTIDAIAAAADQLRRRYDESDPFRLAAAMGILVSLLPMGSYSGCCKGFFIIHRRIKHITINSDLPRELQRMVLAHELGHCVLHASIASSASFHEMSLFDDTELTEYEANVFAAELLLTDEEVLDALNDDAFFYQAASTLCVPAELLDFKFRIMKRRGCRLEAPITASGDFIKKLNVSPD